MKETAGLEKASENAAGSERTPQYNQYKVERKESGEPDKKEEKSIGWC